MFVIGSSGRREGGQGGGRRGEGRKGEGRDLFLFFLQGGGDLFSVGEGDGKGVFVTSATGIELSFMRYIPSCAEARFFFFFFRIFKGGGALSYIINNIIKYYGN